MEKKATVIDSCDRCGKKIVIEQFRSKPAVEATGYSYEHCKDQHVRKCYPRRIKIPGPSSAYIDVTKYHVFCRECDEKFWENFEAANNQMSAFWDGIESENN